MTRYITEGRVSYFSMVLFYGVHDLCNVQGGFIGCPTTSHNSWLQPVMVAFFQPCLAFPSPFSAFQFAHWEWIFGGGGSLSSFHEGFTEYYISTPQEIFPEIEVLWFLAKAWNCGIHLYRYIHQISCNFRYYLYPRDLTVSCLFVQFSEVQGSRALVQPGHEVFETSLQSEVNLWGTGQCIHMSAQCTQVEKKYGSFSCRWPGFIQRCCKKYNRSI